MNPYTPSMKKLFYGRENTFREMLRNEQAGQSVVLIGGRRCGKTCLLERINDYLLQAVKPGSDLSAAWEKAIPDAKQPGPKNGLLFHWPVLIDFQGMHIETYEQALVHMARSIADSKPPISSVLSPCSSVAKKSFTTAPTEDGFDAGQMESWLRQVDARLGEANLGGMALLLDEIEELFAKPWYHELMAFLRRLDDFTLKSRVWIVLAGSDALDNYRAESDGSPALNIYERVFLTGLDYTARKRMAAEPFVKADRLPLPDEAAREVDRLAGGNVWLLTLVLEYLFNLDKITVAAVEDAAGMLLDQQRDIFKRWAKPLGKEGWEMYGQVANQGFLEKEYIKGECRSIRSLLEYQALVHRRANNDIEIGPALFRDWAFEEGKIKKPFASPPAFAGEGEFPPGYYPYDVAISYASPQRDCAAELADALKKMGKKVFYDRDLGHELWGMDLAHCLPDKYDREALLTVLLISKDYIERYWPKVEAGAALLKTMREGWQAVLMVSLDGAHLPGVPGSIVYLDLTAGNKTMSDVAVELVARLNKMEVIK